MFIAYVVLAILLSAMLVMSGRAKLTNDERIVSGLTAAGVPRSWIPRLAYLEIAGAVGLIVGIFIAPIGIAAAIGVVLYFVGAVITHLRIGDFKGLAAPTPLLVAAVVTLVLRITSL
jgi:hypothetical protein